MYTYLIYGVMMTTEVLILKHHNGLCYDDNHNGLLILLICLLSMGIVAPTQNGTPKLRVVWYLASLNTKAKWISLARDSRNGE